MVVSRDDEDNMTKIYTIESGKHSHYWFEDVARYFGVTPKDVVLAKINAD